MKKIPIFIVCGKSPWTSLGGGYGKYTLSLLKVLKKIGHKVFTIHLDKNVNVTALPILPFYSLILSRKIEKICVQKKYQKIIVWGIGPWGLAGAILKRKLKNKVILINNYFTSVKHEWEGMLKCLKVSDYGLLRKIQYLFLFFTLQPVLTCLEEYLLHKADLIIVNYQSTQNILIRQFKLKKYKFFHSSFFLETEKTEVPGPMSQKLPRTFILTVVRHDPRKGINILLHAYKILIDKGYKIPLVIVGTGELFKANIKLAFRLGISSWVKFLGYVRDTTPLMKKAKLFCLPSLEEGAGSIAINEAMMYGLPIVSTNIDGISEDIINKKNGILFKAGNSNDLAMQIKYLLDNPNCANTLGKTARKIYSEKFTQRKMIEDTQRLLTLSLKSK